MSGGRTPTPISTIHSAEWGEGQAPPQHRPEAQPQELPQERVSLLAGLAARSRFPGDSRK